MAEEDLIFGKNRHLFGGIEPSNMIRFTAGSRYEGVKLSCILPKNTIVNGQSLCTVAGAIIRRSETGYPDNEFSGVEVADIKENCAFIDANVKVGKTYYYSAFPYTRQGVYNRDYANRVKITHVNVLNATYIFGYDLDTTNSDPDANVSYPTDVDNVDYTPAYFDQTYLMFKYGDWPSRAGEKFMPKPCMLTYDGVVAEYLNPDDYSKTIDGNDSRVADKTFNGNAMMEWPIIYTHREVVDGVYKFRCSDAKVGDDWDCWCNYDIDDNIIDHFYTAIYNTSIVNGVARSLSQRNPANRATHTLDNILANGDDWYIEELADRLLINDLLIMMCKSTDLQAHFGDGLASGSSSVSYTSVQPTGTLDQCGMFYGYNNLYGIDPCLGALKVFGMEHWWGNLNRLIAGLIYQYDYANNNDITRKYYKVKLTRGLHDGSSVKGYRADGDGYIDLGVGCTVGSNSSTRTVIEMHYQPWGGLPCNANGTNTTQYFCDSVSISSLDKDTTYSVMMGGQYGANTRHAGPFYTSISRKASSTELTYGSIMISNLSYKPSISKEG